MVNCVLLTKVVGTGDPLTRTREPATKLLPVTETARGPPPSVVKPGLRLVIAGDGAGSCTAAENSEVLPFGSVAVAVMSCPSDRSTVGVKAMVALPVKSVSTLTEPMKVWPSGRPPAGSGLLRKNSIRKFVLGETLCVSVPLMRKAPFVTVIELSTGKFWKLFGSLGSPCGAGRPLRFLPASLGVTPSSLG